MDYKEEPEVVPAAQVKHQVSRHPEKKMIGLAPDPSNFFRLGSKIDQKKLKELAYRSILSVNQFDKSHLQEVFKLSAAIQKEAPQVNQILSDKILAAAFFEPSTRTRLSFESAMLRLGGKNITVTLAKTTGVAKGESMRDIGQMFNGYADAVVMRHTEQRALNEISEYLRIPMINGGIGSDEHPTQALADWFALAKWRPELLFGTSIQESEKLHLGIVGTPGNMRTVKSFILLALTFAPSIKKITLISDLADPMGKEVSEYVEKSSVKIETCMDLHEVVQDLDVIYMNSIAFLGDGYQTLGSRYQVNSKTNFKKGAVVLHPLVRLDELDSSLDDTPYNLYFNQANGAVFIRQALLACLFDRVSEVIQELPEEYQ